MAECPIWAEPVPKHPWPDPTCWADDVAEQMRDYYEANRDTLWERFRKRWRYGADNLMLGLYGIAVRSETEKRLLQESRKKRQEGR